MVIIQQIEVDSLTNSNIYGPSTIKLLVLIFLFLDIGPSVQWCSNDMREVFWCFHGKNKYKLDFLYKSETILNFCFQRALLGSKQPKQLQSISAAISNITEEDGPSPPGTFHIFICKFSYFVIRFLNQIFLSLTFPISLSDFYLIAP